MSAIAPAEGTPITLRIDTGTVTQTLGFGA